MVIRRSLGSEKLEKVERQSDRVLFMFVRGSSGSSVEQTLLLSVYLLVFPRKTGNSKMKCLPFDAVIYC